MDALRKACRDASKALGKLRFGPPVDRVYNPLVYAKKPHERYLERFGQGPKEVLLLGMNPGPFGMAQTGVPFGEVAAVRDWIGIEEPVGKPENEHPKRPILGFDCTRSEVSGRRLWGFAQDRFASPEAFFERFFIHNYCPLVFLEETGRNRTPDKLPKPEREPLEAICDQLLQRIVETLQPKHLVGVGAFAEQRAHRVFPDGSIAIGRIPHPSPASPAANRGWQPLAEKAFADLGIEV